MNNGVVMLFLAGSFGALSVSGPGIPVRDDMRALSVRHPDATALSDGDSAGVEGPVWWPLPGIAPAGPDYAQGVSAVYAAAIGGALLTAGGANFPDRPAAQGGRKVYYSDIFLFRNGTWTRAGELPRPAAYGVTVCAGGKVVLAGGSNASGPLKEVLAVGVEGDRVVIGSLPPLPVALDQAAGAAIGNRIYVAGGMADGKPSRALYRLDLEELEAGWRQLAPLPAPLVQPVMAASGGKLYLWGGFDPQRKRVFSAGYCYDPRKGRWGGTVPVPDGGTFTGACAVTLDSGEILCAGGVDRTVFARALRLSPQQMPGYLSQPPAAYRFRKTLYLFHPESRRWSTAGVSPRAARAGAALVSDSGRIYLLSGEVQPGVRTAENDRIEFPPSPPVSGGRGRPAR